MTTLGELIGPMLGADYLYLAGVLVDETDDRHFEHRFIARHARDGAWLRVERSDGLLHTSGPIRSATYAGPRLVEQGPPLDRGSQEFEPLAQPRYAPIWGKPLAEQRLADEVEDLPSGLCRVRLLDIRQPSVEVGELDVDPRTGRIMRMQTPRRLLGFVDLSEDQPVEDAKLSSLIMAPPDAATSEMQEIGRP